MRAGRRGRRTLSAAGAAATLVLLVAVQPVAADRFNGSIPVTGCVGDVVERDLTWSLTRSDLGFQYANGATVKLSVFGLDQPPNAVMFVKLTDATIVLPGDWTSQGNNTKSGDTFSLHLTFQARALGDSGGRIYLVANGRLDYVWVVAEIQCTGSGAIVPILTQPPTTAAKTAPPKTPAPTLAPAGSVATATEPVVGAGEPGESTTSGEPPASSTASADESESPGAVTALASPGGTGIPASTSAPPSAALIALLFGALGAAAGLLAWTFWTARQRSRTRP